MPADLTDEIADIKETEGVIESATAFINSNAARIQAAVDKALENGATAAELQPVTDEVAAMKAKAGELANAIAANP